jgi:hypothetical protein
VSLRLLSPASGTAQLDEKGIQTIASSAFIEWLQHKVEEEGWKVISLLPMAASVRRSRERRSTTINDS